jgi:hypothetical protein
VKQWVCLILFLINLCRNSYLAKEVEQIGALAVYERNLRNANEDFLKEGNFSETPSINVLNTAKQQHNKKYHFDGDNFKDIRMFGFFTRHTDYTSKDVIGEKFYTLLITTHFATSSIFFSNVFWN